MKLILTKPQKAKIESLNQSVAHAWSETGPIVDKQRETFTDRCTMKTFFVDGVSLDLVGTTERPFEFFIPRVVNKHVSLPAFHLAAIIFARHSTYAFFSTKCVKTFWRIDCDHPAFDSLQSIFLEMSIRMVAKDTNACASSGFGMSSFRSMKMEIMHRVFAFLADWTDASALQKEIFTKPKVLSTFPTEAHLELFCFIRYTLLG